MTLTTAAMCLSNIGFSFGPPGETDGPLLETFSLRVALRESVALMGASGLGKSTLGMLLGGLLQPQTGAIERHASLGRPRDVVYLDQDPLNTLFPWQTARENVEYPLRRLGSTASEARRRADELLAVLGLSRRADAFPRSLSGGERQRLALARVLGWGPGLLVLDESFSALDVGTRADAIDIVRDACAEQSITLVIITHSVADVMALATRCVVLGSRPLQVVADLAIDAPFPRAETDPAYVAARERLIDAVRDGLL